jgi:hypothetical protein
MIDEYKQARGPARQVVASPADAAPGGWRR